MIVYINLGINITIENGKFIPRFRKSEGSVRVYFPKSFKCLLIGLRLS